MNRVQFILIISCFSISFLPTIVFGQTIYPIPFEKDNNTTATYHEAIAHYKKLAQDFGEFRFIEAGTTDIGKPLYLGILSKAKLFTANENHSQLQQIVMINNAIHAGEACGVDATMGLIRDLLEHPDRFPALTNTTIIFIPMYNVGGVLNRNSHTRVNQNGPESYGFRGNAKNLDLNRDFIKCDSKNAQSFNQIFSDWQPHIFIDNHTSNGADYPYTMTLVSTQAEKLGGPLAAFQKATMLPFLFDQMKKQKWEMTPYVYATKGTPEKGITGFLDLPRYSSGYAAQKHCLGFMPETHMLKPFKDRVLSTKAFSIAILQFINTHGQDLLEARRASESLEKTQRTFALNWEIDSTKIEHLMFKGYTAKMKTSDISGQERLYYDHNAPYEKNIIWENTYKASKMISRPKGYFIPQAYVRILDRLEWNNISVTPLTKDTAIKVNRYVITDFKTTTQPYEGHYLHYDIQVEPRIIHTQYYAGDYYVDCNQPGVRYIIESLEPMAPDSYFAWNFFDGILQQKEYFSSYVFEDTGLEILESDKDLKRKFEQKKKEDEAFAKNGNAQLQYIYDHSKFKEKTVNLYPIGRLE